MPVRNAVRRLYPNREQMVMVMIGSTMTVNNNRMMSGIATSAKLPSMRSDNPIAMKKITPKNSFRDFTVFQPWSLFLLFQMQ